MPDMPTEKAQISESTTKRGIAIEGVGAQILRNCISTGDVAFKVGHIAATESNWSNAKQVYSTSREPPDRTLNNLVSAGVTPQTLSCDFILKRGEGFCFVEVKGTTDSSIELTSKQYASMVEHEDRYFVLVVRYKSISNLLTVDVKKDPDALSGQLKPSNKKPNGVLCGSESDGTKITVANWQILKMESGKITKATNFNFVEADTIASKPVTSLLIKHGVKSPDDSKAQSSVSN